mgnify:CR=1 FL=1
MDRRRFLGFVAGLMGSAGLAGPAAAAGGWLFGSDYPPMRPQAPLKPRRRYVAKPKKAKGRSARKAAGKKRHGPVYAGRRVVPFASGERPGTIIIRTAERALYQVMPGGRAMRYLVAVGREGFSWSGTARVGMKREWPVWTPPAEMIDREPKFAKWAEGMPGGPKNPLGARAMYLYNKRGDTGFRIHGTNNPSSIGHAASSGCIRMLNNEVIALYAATPRGTKVIVQ